MVVLRNVNISMQPRCDAVLRRAASIGGRGKNAARVQLNEDARGAHPNWARSDHQRNVRSSQIHWCGKIFEQVSPTTITGVCEHGC